MSAGSTSSIAFPIQQSGNARLLKPLVSQTHRAPASQSVPAVRRALNCPRYEISTRDVPAAVTEIERRNRLVVRHLHMVAPIAAGMLRKLPSHVELNDLVQTGTLGLIDAAGKYDPEMGSGFPPYARHRIRGAIIDGLRHFDPASRTLRQQHKQIDAIRIDLTATLKREPSDGEIAGRMGIKLKRFRSIMLDVRGILTKYQSRKDEGFVELDAPCEVRGQPDSITEGRRLRSSILDAIGTLPERYQEIVILYHFKELPMAEIAEMLRIDQSRVSQIRSAALKQMGTVLRAKGISSSSLFLV